MITAYNVDTPEDRSANTAIKYRLYYALQRDVDIEAWGQPTDATINVLPMKAGKYAHYIDCRADSVRPNAASAGDIVPTNQPTIVADVLGMSKALLKFLIDFNGADMFIIWEHCKTGQKFIAGSACGALKMTYTKAGTDDSFTGATLQWTGTCEAPFYYFDGNIPLETPVSVDQDVTTFQLAAKAQYLLPENTEDITLTDITGVTDADAGRIIDILGNGINFPTMIEPTNKFILQGGDEFAAVQGSRISFEIIKTGPTDFAFLEVARG